MNALDSSLLLGLDSALCCFAIGCTSLAWNARLRLAFAFGACDAIASAAGALLYALPVLFSLDNFSYGDGLGNAIIDGMGSAVLALGALAAGALAFWLFRGTWPRASSAGEY
jgi:hypothetical protein